MDTYSLEWHNMASILCLDSDHSMEIDPQPIRGTPQLTVIIPFNQYVKFLQALPKDFKLLFRTPDKALADPVSSYYFDVARAVGKELYFCWKNRMSPTHFRHQFDGPTETQPELNFEDFSSAFRHYLEVRNFDVYPEGPMKMEWVYACILCGCSQRYPNTRWNIL